MNKFRFGIIGLGLMGRKFGLSSSAKFTTDDPNAFSYLETRGKEQAWPRIVVGGKPDFGCVTPEETAISHRLMTASLKSNKNKSLEEVNL